MPKLFIKRLQKFHVNTFKWSRGVSMDPKSVARKRRIYCCYRFLTFYNYAYHPAPSAMRLKKIALAIALGSPWTPPPVDIRVYINMDLWYYYISILIEINHNFITIYLLICNFIHKPFVRHPVQMNGENMLWEKCCKTTEMIVKSLSFFFVFVFVFVCFCFCFVLCFCFLFLFFVFVFVFFVFLFVLVLNMLFCLFSSQSITKQSPVNFLVQQNGENAKSKWPLFGQNPRHEN